MRLGAEVSVALREDNTDVGEKKTSTEGAR